MKIPQAVKYMVKFTHLTPRRDFDLYQCDKQKAGEIRLDWLNKCIFWNEKNEFGLAVKP